MVTTEALRRTTIDRLPSTVLVGTPAGNCTGVDRIIERITMQALTLARREGRPVKALHEPVHNRIQSDQVRDMGIAIVEDVADITPGDVVITSAHGVSPEIMGQLQGLETTVLDGTCPLVRKVHDEVRRALAKAKEEGAIPQIVYIGKKGHREAEGVIGEAPENIIVVRTMEDIKNLNLDPNRRQYVFSQTTLIVEETRKMMEALQMKFPDIEVPPVDDSCFATQNRQGGADLVVKAGAQVMLVLGELYSSNSASLRDYIERQGVTAHLFPDEGKFEPRWIMGHDIIGVTAGASASVARIIGLKGRLVNLGIPEEAFRSVGSNIREPNFTSLAPVRDFRKGSK